MITLQYCVRVLLKKIAKNQDFCLNLWSNRFGPQASPNSTVSPPGLALIMVISIPNSMRHFVLVLKYT